MIGIGGLLWVVSHPFRTPTFSLFSRVPTKVNNWVVGYCPRGFLLFAMNSFIGAKKKEKEK
jgi:hypothetical protein